MTFQDIQRQIYEAEQKRATAVKRENMRLNIQSEYQREIEDHDATIAHLNTQAREARLNETIEENRKLVAENDQDGAALLAAANDAADKLLDLFSPLNIARSAYERCEHHISAEADRYGDAAQTDPEDSMTFKRESGRAMQQMLDTATPITPYSRLVEWVAQSKGDHERAARQAIAYLLLNTLPAPTPDFSAREASAKHLRDQRRRWHIMGG